MDKEIKGIRKVLIITEDLGGGTGRHMLSRLSCTDLKRWPTEIILVGELTSKPPFPVKLHQLKGGSSWFDRFPFTQIRHFLYLYRYLSRNRADIVHTFFFWPIIYGRILKWMGKVNNLVENREDQGFNWGRFEYVLLRITGRAPDKIISVSDAVKKSVIEKERQDPENVEVIRNGIRVSPLAAGPADQKVRREFGIAGGELVVGMVANFNRTVKGVNYYIEAMPKILERFPGTRFFIIGGGAGREMLENKVNDLGLSGNVHFTGVREDVEDFYHAMDISVLTSMSEGLSITLLESMERGLPVVVTDVGGNPEVVIEGETGYLVPPKDIPHFAGRVIDLLDNPNLRREMGRKARERIENIFPIQSVALRYEKLYEGLIKLS